MTPDAQPPMHRSCLCPELTHAAWEDSTVSYATKPFLARRIPLLFRIPIGLKEEIRALKGRAAALKLDSAVPPVLLQKDLGLFRGQLLWGLGDDAGLPEAVFLTGMYRTAVHRGSYAQLGRAAKRFTRSIQKDLGIRPEEVLYWYANCPACWQADGGPVTIILARIGNPEPPCRTIQDSLEAP